MSKLKRIKQISRNGMACVIRGALILFYGLLTGIGLLALQLVPHVGIRRRGLTICKWVWFHILLSLLDYWFRDPVYVRLDRRVLASKRTITISNHCSDYDWFFLLILFHCINKDDTRILLKKELSEVPLLGYILQKFGHIYLNRNRAKDVKIIKSAVAELNETPEYNVAMYPEGTYLFSESIERAQKWAKETEAKVDNEPFIPKLVLFPRRTGFSTLADGLKESYDGVIDVTIIMNPYVHMPPEDCPPYELFVNKKQVMNQMLLVDFVPKEELTKEFLERSFKKKEERIGAFLECTAGEVDSKEAFDEMIDRIEGAGADYETITLCPSSPYKPLVFILPVASLLGVLIWITKLVRG